MHNTGRGEEKETVEDMAASVLAATYGYGSTWHADEVRHRAGERDDTGTPMIRNRYALPVCHQGDVVEQATRYVPQDYEHWPAWVTRLAPEDQARLIAWSDANPLQTRRGDIGEHEKWTSTRVEVSIPEVRMRTRVLGALHDARLTPPQSAMLRAFAVEDRSAAETVLRFAVASGHDRNVALNALVYRVMYPNARRLHHSLKQRAWELGMREASYRAAESAAADLLRTWLHVAAVRFMRAHGFVKRTFVPPAALRTTARKRSRPRFRKGWDTRQRPGPLVIVGRAKTAPKDGSTEGDASAYAEPSSRVA